MDNMMKKARYCYDCIHKDVCKYAEEAATVETAIDNCKHDIPLRILCKLKHEDRM